jgi:hypothetical protein
VAGDGGELEDGWLRARRRDLVGQGVEAGVGGGGETAGKPRWREHGVRRDSLARWGNRVRNAARCGSGVLGWSPPWQRRGWKGGREEAAAVGSGGAAGHVEMATGAGFWFWAAGLKEWYTTTIV